MGKEFTSQEIIYFLAQSSLKHHRGLAKMAEPGQRLGKRQIVSGTTLLLIWLNTFDEGFDDFMAVLHQEYAVNSLEDLQFFVVKDVGVRWAEGDSLLWEPGFRKELRKHIVDDGELMAFHFLEDLEETEACRKFTKGFNDILKEHRAESHPWNKNPALRLSDLKQAKEELSELEFETEPLGPRIFTQYYQKAVYGAFVDLQEAIYTTRLAKSMAEIVDIHEALKKIKRDDSETRNPFL